MRARQRRALVVWGVAMTVAFGGLWLAERASLWRRLQSVALERERAALEGLLSEERRRLETGQGAELHAQLAAESRRLEEHAPEIVELEGGLARLRRKIRLTESRLAEARAALAADGRVDDRHEEVRDRRAELESLREMAAEADRRLSQLRRPWEEIEGQLSSREATLTRLEDRLAELEPPWPGAPWRWLHDPRIGLRETYPAGFFEVRGGRRVRRVDRCTTCHVGALRGRGWVGSPDGGPPAWLAPHPRPDLWVADGSPHPAASFGCTICHGGEGRATGFTRAGHIPRRLEDAERWRRELGWRPPGTARPILAGGLAQAACWGCHRGGRFAAAPALEEGLALARRMGCWTCHLDRGAVTEEPVRPGPSLHGLASRSTRAWVYHWIAGPRRQLATAWMPHLFGDLERLEGAEAARRRAEIAAIVAYLWGSGEAEAPIVPPPSAGDPSIGRRLFTEIGCSACHRLDDPGTRGELVDRPDSSYGPSLVGIGSRVTASWLYSWLRDPQELRPGTPMPDLRLDEEEASHLTAFLMNERRREWEELAQPPVEPERRDELVLAELETETTLEDAAARLAAMDVGQREIYLGERAAARYRCARCHALPGPVSNGGSVEPLAELGEPGAFPHGAHPEPLRRLGGGRGVQVGGPSPPLDYGLDRRETEALLIALLASRPLPIVATRRPARPPEAGVLSRGRELWRRFGCQACHRLDGAGVGTFEAGQEPPALTGEGARVRPEWLDRYLDRPGSVSIRPWLKVRMPRYALTDDERYDLVRFFAAMSGSRLLVGEAEAASPRTVAIGKAVFAFLQCGGCHAGGAQGAAVGLEARAPRYELARQRLRPEWVVEWILRPGGGDGGSSTMPSHFVGDDGQLDASFLVATLDAPMFSDELEKLVDLFASEEEARRYLGDARQVAIALQAYLWSLGS